MVLVGKLSTEDRIKTPAAKCFNLFASQLHNVQNLCDRVHGTKIHQGEDWHHSDSVKHWTYVIDGKVHTCNETIDEVDEQNKKVTWNLFGGDIDGHFKVFKLSVQAIDKADGSDILKWTVEYEKINEDVETPNGWMDFLANCTKDIDAKLSGA